MSTPSLSLSPIVGTLCSELPLRYSTDEFAQLLANSTAAEGAMPPRLRNIVQRCKTAIIRFNSKTEANTTSANKPWWGSSFLFWRKRSNPVKNACIVKLLIAVVDGFEAAYDHTHHADLTAGDVKYSGKFKLPEDLFYFEAGESYYLFTRGITDWLSRWGTNVQEALYYIKPLEANTISADSEDDDEIPPIRWLWHKHHVATSRHWFDAVQMGMGMLTMLELDEYWGGNGLLNEKFPDRLLLTFCVVFAISPIMCLGPSSLVGPRTLDVRDLLQNIARNAATLRDRIHKNLAFRNIEHAILRALGEGMERSSVSLAILEDRITEKVFGHTSELAKPIQLEWDSLKASVNFVQIDRFVQVCMSELEGNTMG